MKKFWVRQIELGKQAQSLKNSDAFNQSLEDVRADFMEAWKNTPLNDTQTRERLYMGVLALDRIEGKLIQYINDKAINEHNEGKK